MTSGCVDREKGGIEGCGWWRREMGEGGEGGGGGDRVGRGGICERVGGRKKGGVCGWEEDRRGVVK